MTSAGKKELIVFNDYWPHLIKEQLRQRLGKVEWMHRSGLYHGRYSQFDNKFRGKSGKDITAYYFLRLTAEVCMSEHGDMSSILY